MAQYYQVLSQDDKNPDEVSQFYEHVDENQSVQYVIATDGSQQQVQAQPVVLASEQLMVLDGQGQQVIIDQSQVAYQSPSYAIQDTNGLEFQNKHQQVYYVTNAPQNQHIVVEQPLQQPVVLNHQMLSNQGPRVMNSPVPQNCSSSPVNTSVVQDKTLSQHPLPNQLKPLHVIRQGSNMVNARGVQQKSMGQGGPQSLTNFQTQNTNDKVDEEELINLPDRTVVDYPNFRKFMAQQKQNQNIVDKLSSTPNPPSRKPIGGGGRNTGGRNQNSKSRRSNAISRNSSFASNSSVDDQYEEPTSVKQNSHFQQQRQQQINRTASVAESRNQYLIQPPRPRDKQQTLRPLPHFLHSAQIENIIANTPMSEEYSDSIRMLVLLDNGEQRLITFTLPKEACTIQEILEQVNVPFTKETPIQVSETNSNGLNYIVAVGHVPGFSMETQQQEENLPQENDYNHQSLQGESDQSSIDTPKSTSQSSSPEPCKDIPAKIIEGQLALCANCGYLSEDFSKCLRCKRRLPDNVKAIPSPNNKKLDSRMLLNDKRLSLQKGIVPRINLLPKKRPAKPKLIECETVVVSSDEEDSEKKTHVKNVSERLLEKLGAAVTLSPISKEPSIVEIQKSGIMAHTKAADKIPSDQINSCLVLCRTIRIGSYRYVPPEPIRIDSNGLLLKVPHPKSDNSTIQVLRIDSSDIVKVLISFQKSLPVLFYYLIPSIGVTIRNALEMTQGSDFYFDPLSEIEEAHRRITLLPESLSDDCKQTLQKIYSRNALFDELTYKEANDILIKTCPKELSKSVLSYSVSEIKTILMYPREGRGRITINTEDYMCLGQDQFLNDVIIDFYLKYLVLNMPQEQQDKVHIFSTFFYKRLTTKPMKASRKSQPSEMDPNLTPAEKRHSRVKTWTKNVNIFEKDFIIVPINENCHWFLAIICYPNMKGSHTMDGQPIKIEPRQSKKKKVVSPNAGKEKKLEPQAIVCEDGEMSDKDEAEGDESELDSDDSEELPPTLSVENNSKRPPIKQPCILIFDSLAGASRSRVVATLRDYLTCEFKAKMSVEKTYTKDVIKGACPKVPQQTNFTDCGLYLLQYVEQFFADPIKDYYIPISHLKTWFEEITVTKKREDISLLIKSLMEQSGKELDILPEVIFPTLNGELTERALMDKGDKFMDPDEQEDEDDEEYVATANKKCDHNSETGEINSETFPNSPIKPSNESVNSRGEVIEQTINTVLKPDISELPKQSNKDTLSYLKAKRIVRHKNVRTSDEPDAKKVKSADTSV